MRSLATRNWQSSIQYSYFHWMWLTLGLFFSHFLNLKLLIKNKAILFDKKPHFWVCGLGTFNMVYISIQPQEFVSKSFQIILKRRLAWTSKRPFFPFLQTRVWVVVFWPNFPKFFQFFHLFDIINKPICHCRQCSLLSILCSIIIK